MVLNFKSLCHIVRSHVSGTAWHRNGDIFFICCVGVSCAESLLLVLFLEKLVKVLNLKLPGVKLENNLLLWNFFTGRPPEYLSAQIFDLVSHACILISNRLLVLTGP